MTVGERSAWNDLFAHELVPTVLVLVLDACARIAKPTDNEHQDDTPIRLYCAVLTGKARNRAPFLIQIQDVEVDMDLLEISGRKDITFFPSVHDEDIYFCLEAKRLNAVVGGVSKSLADEYVKHGMQRFVDAKYSGSVRHGGMIGYVLDGDVGRAMKNVAKNISANHQALLMDPPGTWMPSSVRPSDPHAKESGHHRAHESVVFRIHHLFVAK